MRNNLVTIDPDILSGEPVFTGTRVPVRNLIDYLAAGHSLDYFLEGFSNVPKSQAVEFLIESGRSLVEETLRNAEAVEPVAR